MPIPTGQPTGHAVAELAAACRSSLERSRARRAVAARLRARRLRHRSGGGAFTAATVALALAAPLSLAHATSTGHPQRLLSAGSHGAAVSLVQHALGLDATGVYDTSTRRAVRAFQRAHGLLVDGIVGPQTRAALGIANAAAVGGGASAGGPAASDGEGQGAAPPATLARIAACESGGNPRAVSADGRYRGKYQFSRATWRAIGGSGDPAAAPESVQDAMAAKLLAREGTSPWPSCG